MRICYFTLTATPPTRDLVYLNGLRGLGVEIIECRDATPGIRKFWNLWRKHQLIKNDYDIVLVGFSGHILVPFIRLISQKKIVFNALSSMSDGIIGSRKQYGFLGLNIIYCWLVDWLAFNSAHLSLLDTNTRKQYVSRKFLVPKRKLTRLLSGVDDSAFVYDPTIKKLPTFTILFRGALMPEAGIEHLVVAADLLRKEPIQFRILGKGFGAPLLEKMIKDLALTNIEWLPDRLTFEQLSLKMQECHISLGQLSDHPRQQFHVPFKTIESMALKIPYLITRNSYGLLEFLTDNETCFCFNPADPESLAEKIMWLKDRPEQLERVSENAYQLFKSELTTSALATALNRQLKAFI